MLDRTVAIVVPSKTRTGALIRHHEAECSLVLGTLARMFGGATAVEGLGAYVMPSGEAMFERVSTVTSYASAADIEKNRDALGTFARDLCLTLQQDAIALVIDGTLTLVRA